MLKAVRVLVLVLLGTAAQGQTKITLLPHVDERVELLSIVFRVAGNPEYNMSQLKAYTGDIDAYFAPYKSHPAVAFARKMRETRGVSFDAVMDMAIHVSDAPALHPLVPLTNQVPDSRWGKDNAVQFLELLRNFYRDSHFDKFFAAHRPMYQLAESRFQTVLNAVNLDWYREFYGETPKGNFHLVLGMNNGGGNYGPRLVLPDGREELFAIMGCWTIDNDGNPTYTLDGGYLSTIIHEFNHSFVNPLVDRHWKDLAATNSIYVPVSEKMESQAYGNAKTMVYESLVRAAVILYFESKAEAQDALARRIRSEQGRGFVWIPELCELLRRYAADRQHYPTFASYMPKVVQFYRELAPHIGEKIANFNRNSAHVTALSPFANHAQEADPASTELIITFDKPLDPAKGFSINVTEAGWEHNPLAGMPVFLEGGRSLKLPLKLKPNWNYSFVLTPYAFATSEGYPLESYTVDFKTK